VVRLATEEDARALSKLAQLDSQRPLGGQILIGELDGHAAAAISLADNRVVSDPFKATAQIAQMLRMRAAGLHAVAETPSLRERIRNGVRVTRGFRPPAEAV
jgi:hypothetical protein